MELQHRRLFNLVLTSFCFGLMMVVLGDPLPKGISTCRHKSKITSLHLSLFSSLIEIQK